MGLSSNNIVQILLRERVRISASVMTILRDAHAADDVFQQVVLRALEGQEHFREPEHLLAWALRVARHRAIDALPRRGMHGLDGAVLDLLEQQWAAAPADDVPARVEALHRCMEKLPDPARDLLRLRYEDGLRCTTIAEQLGRSADAVYQTLSRVHRQLRQCVEARLQAGSQSLGEAML